MTLFREMLAAGDLRSDGLANDVVAIVRANPALVADLVATLDDADAAVRGHAADALEKVARLLPQQVAAHLPTLGALALHDSVPMVRWHMAMALGHVGVLTDRAAQVVPTLVALLADDSAIVASWAVSSLTLLARVDPALEPVVTPAIAPLAHAGSAAVAKRAQTALRLLADGNRPIPPSWLKIKLPPARGRLP